MKIDHIVLYSTDYQSFASSEFEDAMYDSMLRYSLRHIPFSENIAQEHIKEAIQKSLQVCYLAGIDSKQHFKQIYVSDTMIGTLYIDWLMSKKGVNLMVMQISSLNEKMALWLWELAE